MSPSGVTVVGASAAGLGVAENLRREGFAGRITLVGEEPHLPYDRPPLSKQLLSGAWAPERLRLRAPEALDALDVALRLGVRATGLDTAGRQVVLADGERIGYDALVVATGVRPRALPDTRDLAGVYGLRTVEDALALREALRPGRRLAVVGGGFVGAEAAAVAAGLGVRVTLITDDTAPLAAVLGRALGSMVAAVHREHGVRVVTRAVVEAVTRADGRATGVLLDDGTRIAADAVLVGIGSLPNTEWLRGSGVPRGDGVECDATLHAGAGVWAAGDVARWCDPRHGPTRIEHRTNAAEQARLVARNLLAKERDRTAFAPVPYVWSDQYDLRIQIYGRTRGADRIDLMEGSPDERRLVALYSGGGRIRGVVGVNAPRATRAYRPAVAAADARLRHGPALARLP
ncbi:NAD(P)/FAD-dependent oxidoreductase [Streptomyces tendae]